MTLTQADILRALRQYRHRLPRQTIKILRGQALAGDIHGAALGLQRVLRMTTGRETDTHDQ